MFKNEISQDEIDALVDDASYLVDEAEALKYVIDSVPYDETPPGGMSIQNLLRLVDHAQVEYFRPIIENVFSENRLQKLSDYEHYKDTFEPESAKNDESDIQKTLSRLIKHRAAFLNSLSRITQVDWMRKLRSDSGEEMILFQFASDMIKQERNILKKIADLVLIYQNERQHQREINKKSLSRKNI